MFEENDGQNGSLPEKTDNGGFVNQKALQFDPDNVIAYPKFGQLTTDQKPADLPPINPRDDQGKTLPKYRMGIGQRILGTVANFANGFARNGAEPIYVGPGALNNRYYQDQELRQQQNLSNSAHTPPRGIKGTQFWEDGSNPTNNSSLLKTNAQSQTRARLNWRGILNPQKPTGNLPTYSALNHQTGQRIVSDDGVNWRMHDPDSTLT
jgi:hypothetical protein